MGYGLMLVGAQRDRLEGARAVAGAAELGRALGALLEAARDAGVPIVHVQHDGAPGQPDAPGSPGWGPVFPPAPGEPVVRTEDPDTFLSNPALADVLHAMGVDTLVVAGPRSEHSVQSTALGALERGFAVVVPTGAHATHDGDAPAAEVAARVTMELAAGGVQVVELDAVVFR